MQLLWRCLLFAAAGAVVFFFTLNRLRLAKEPSVVAIQEPETETVITESLPSESIPATVSATPTPEATHTPEETPMPEKTKAEQEAEAREAERLQLLALSDAELAVELRTRGVPEDLVEFMESYPETREFVTGYLYQPQIPPSMDISGEVQKGQIPHFLQWDDRWGYAYYDDSYFAVAGCGPTALSEIYSGLTGKSDRNPYEMGVWATEMGYHVRGSGTSWAMMSAGAEVLGLTAWGVDRNAEALTSTLRDGHPMICAVSPGDFTHFGHFIVLTEIDEGGNITVLDSNSRERSARTWTCDELLWQVTAMWAYAYE